MHQSFFDGCTERRRSVGAGVNDDRPRAKRPALPAREKMMALGKLSADWRTG
jgi:hypothetical protein